MTPFWPYYLSGTHTRSLARTDYIRQANTYIISNGIRTLGSTHSSWRSRGPDCSQDTAIMLLRQNGKAQTASKHRGDSQQDLMNRTGGRPKYHASSRFAPTRSESRMLQRDDVLRATSTNQPNRQSSSRPKARMTTGPYRHPSARLPHLPGRRTRPPPPSRGGSI